MLVKRPDALKAVSAFMDSKRLDEFENDHVDEFIQTQFVSDRDNESPHQALPRG